MKNIYAVLLSLFVGACISGAVAQTVSLPYQMSFEEADSVELRNKWTLNPGADAPLCKDQWIIGRSEHSAGRQALYISNNGSDAWFDTVPCVQYAYMDIQLPAGTRVDLSFDWKCIGASGNTPASLYVGWNTPQNLQVDAINRSAAVPGTILNRLTWLKAASGQEEWTNYISSFNAPADGRAMRLVFAWVNANTDPDACTIGACIDNLVITNSNCKRPYDIAAEVVTCDSVLVSWSGTSASYELAFRAAGSDVWSSYRNIEPSITDATKASFHLVNMSEGSYDFRVRGICTPDTSAWSYYNGFVVFCPETHCVNFTDLYAPTVTCTYGTTTYGGQCYDDPANRAHAYDNVGVVDYGSDAKLSRHTVNWDKMATDPRTGGDLPLIPKNGYASVRLGNWEWGNGAESITYDYLVDETSGVLLMQYAVVLEYPSGHKDEQMPRFVLEILDEDGNLLDPSCGVRNFFAKEADGVNWKSYGSGGYYGEQVVYKPWTTIGLNLKEMGIADGTHIKVRLTTYDCFLSGHYGYAYFTLDCVKATIESASCAKDETLTMHLVAPEGFKYQWYNPDGTAISDETTREYSPKDTLTYRCRLTSTENADCYFDLYSACVPRLPVPSFTAKLAGKDCRNRMNITNKSYVKVVQRDTTIIYYNEHPDSYLWETWGTLSDGTHFVSLTSDRDNPIFDYPDEGGDFWIKLTAYLHGTCEESDSTLIHIKPIGDYGPFERDTTLCFPSGSTQKSVWLEEQEIKVSGKYTTIYKTVAGCDSTIIWNVSLGSDTVTQLTDTTICYGETLCVGETCIGPGNPLYRTGMWQWKGKTRASCECDSIIMRKVTLREEMKPTLVIDSINQKLNKFYATITIGGTGFTGYTVNYRRGENKREVTETHTAADMQIDSLNTGKVTFVFRNDYGCELEQIVILGGSCLKMSLLEQQQCLCGKSVIRYELKIDSGIPTRYRIDFGALALAQQFVNTGWVNVPDDQVIDVAVPASAEPGKYDATIVFEDVVCGDKSFPVNMTLTYDSSIIFHRWNNNAIISLKNATYAKKVDGSDYANYNFTGFQWLHNGRVVDGEDRSYMEQPGTLNPADSYQVRLTRTDGAVLTSCPYVPANAAAAPSRRAYSEDVDASIVSPTAPRCGQPVSLDLRDAARVELYSALGQRVGEYVLPEGRQSIEAPAAPGLYILNIYCAGEKVTAKLNVR